MSPSPFISAILPDGKDESFHPSFLNTWGRHWLHNVGKEAITAVQLMGLLWLVLSVTFQWSLAVLSEQSPGKPLIQDVWIPAWCPDGFLYVSALTFLETEREDMLRNIKENCSCLFVFITLFSPLEATNKKKNILKAFCFTSDPHTRSFKPWPFVCLLSSPPICLIL